MDEPKNVARDLAIAERRSAEGHMLVLEGDPEAQLRYAEQCAKALVKRIKPLKIGDSEHVRIDGWQMLGHFYNSTIGTEWSRPVERDGKIIGYEARATVHRYGEIIATAEAQCFRDERSWRNKPEFMLRSMAQTRAGSRAMRNALGWVVTLAGYSSTPAEEVDEETGELPPKQIEGIATEFKTETGEQKPEQEITIDLLKDLLGKVSAATKLEFWHRAGVDSFDELQKANYSKAAKWLREQTPK